MTGWPDHPVIYEINTALWLDGLFRAAGHLGRCRGAALIILLIVLVPGLFRNLP